jgi:hypothetical protein
VRVALSAVMARDEIGDRRIVVGKNGATLVLAEP